MKKEQSILIICGLLQLMFAYAAISKIMEMEKFRAAINLQPIPLALRHLAGNMLPLYEMIIVMLLFKPYQIYGLWLSAVTMFAFSLYIALGLMDMLGHMPCSCGGILGSLPLSVHLIFNLLFFALSLCGIFTIQRKEVTGTKQ